MSDMLTAKEVAKRFGVGPKTVARWAKAGLVSHVLTPGGHRRFRRADVEALERQLDRPAAHVAE